MAHISYFFVNPYHERCMVIRDGQGTGVILDPGFVTEEEKSQIFGFISDNGITIEAVLLTHSHFDHIYGVKECIGKYGVPVYMNSRDKVVKDNALSLAKEMNMPIPDTSWETTDVHEGDILRFGDLEFEIIETPGHSPGSVCYYDRKSGDLFSGDTLFAGTIGQTSLKFGDYNAEILSIMEKLMILDSDVCVHPCHGGGTTIGYERTHNPFLEPFNELDPETGAVDGISADE